MKTLLLQDSFKGMKDLRTHPESFPECCCTYGSDHELLKCNWRVTMRPGIDDIHHRHRQHIGIRCTEITIERNTLTRSCSLGNGKRNRQNGIGAQP